jgi:Lon protease-like protein
MYELEIELKRACSAMPIFPLPRTVMMPGSVVPLHVFEHRYRALIEHALRASGLMAIATLMPGYEKDYDGRPPIWPEVGVGQMIAHQELADGRSNVLLRCVARGVIVRELPPDHTFREAEIELLHDERGDTSAASARIRGLISQVGGYSAEASTEATRLLQLDGVELIDALARKLIEDPDEQRRYLRQNSLSERAKIVEGALGEILAVVVVGAAEA